MQGVHGSYFRSFGLFSTDDTEREGNDCYCFLERGVRVTVNLNRADS